MKVEKSNMIVNGVPVTADHLYFSLPIATPPSEWHRSANKKARKEVKERGLLWRDTAITVILPEKNRLFTKAPGFEQMIAFG